MSEYWKSTPKYWCKHCKIYVRDTKLEKQNHDASPKHQGNLKRFLRDLHRGHEKDEKDKERAKSEVARLNGLVSGSVAGESSRTAGLARGSSTMVPKPQATPSQRKQQLAQLAEMGVSIPDEFRGEMAMAGEWQVTAERVIGPTDGQEKQPEAIGFGVRKRPLPGDEDEDEIVDVKKKRWGSSYRIYQEEADNDLDSLLANTKPTFKLESTPMSVKKEDPETLSEGKASIPELETLQPPPLIKTEVTDGEADGLLHSRLPEMDPKTEEDAVTNVVFKKRKPKNIRKT